jgi:hypothetical protein
MESVESQSWLILLNRLCCEVDSRRIYVLNTPIRSNRMLINQVSVKAKLRHHYERWLFLETTVVLFALRVVPCEMSHHLVETITSIIQRCVALALVKDNHPAWSHNTQTLPLLLFNWRLEKSTARKSQLNSLHTKLLPSRYAKEIDAVNAGFPVPNIWNFAHWHIRLDGNGPRLT